MYFKALFMALHQAKGAITMITIRSAKPTDARQIAKILMVIFDQMGITELPPADLETRVTQCFADQAFLGEIAETLVAETSGTVVGVAFSYHADQESAVGAHWNSAFTDVSMQIQPESETLPGEWYLELLATAPATRSQGVGAKLLAATKSLAEQYGAETLALNVDLANPRAEKLYRRQGYQLAGEMTILGHQYRHLELKLD